MRSLRWPESFLETLHRCGFGDPACVGAYRAFSRYPRGAPIPALSNRSIRTTNPPPTSVEYARLKSLEHELSQDHSADEFDEALETLLERIDLREHHRQPATPARNAEPHHPDACGNP